MTERKGLLPLVQRGDFYKVKEARAKNPRFLNELLDRLANENLFFAAHISDMARKSSDPEQVMKTSLYVYALIESASKCLYAVSAPEYTQMPKVTCESAKGVEQSQGLGIEMIERMREDNPIIAEFVDYALGEGNDPERTLEAAGATYRLLELAAEERLRKIRWLAN